ncbi:MAG: asparagine synthetase B [Nitrospiraceae bacterium]|nr:MAG: asparagine synthetase B [Nitrospiraceae bacterium]
MCGITVCFSFGAPIDATRFREATLALRHRGGDDEHMVFLNNSELNIYFALGHCRLAIYDLSSAARQPMKGAGGRWIVFNGSIFNWRSLRRELVAAGYEFRSECDTEVILAAFDYWGPSCVKHFNGFWAFVILEPDNTTNGPLAFISRDRFGIKPLYYASRGDVLFFSSEITPIWTYFAEKPKPNINQLHRYLVYDLSHDSPETIYDQIYEIEPASNAMLFARKRELKIGRYWSLRIDDSLSHKTETEILDQFSALLEDSVRLRLHADRPVALTLSGGIDSTAIALAASRVSSGPLVAYTSYFGENQDIDESNFARQAASLLRLQHFLVHCDKFNLRDEERKLTRHQELMYTSFSMLVNWNVVRSIRETGTRIYLTGQGGDEVMIGYHRYFSTYLYETFRHSNVARILPCLRDIARHNNIGMLRLLAIVAYFWSTSIRRYRYLRDARTFLTDEFVYSLAHSLQNFRVSLPVLQEDEISGSQLRRLLRYDDRTAGAFGIEARPAFLDHRLVEFCYSLPWRFKIRHGWTKYLVRRYLHAHGLRTHAWRTRKLGYEAPTLDWTNLLLPKILTWGGCQSLNGILRDDVAHANVPDRVRFKLLNLISTAEVLGWR